MTSNSDLARPGILEVPTDQWIVKGGFHVWYQRHGHVRSLVKALIAEGRLRPDIIYVNSLWGMRYAALYLVLRRVRLTDSVLLLAPRGQLNEPALAIKPFKKKVSLAAMRVFGLLREVVMHVSSDEEAASVRSVLGDQVRIIVSPNVMLVKGADLSSLPLPTKVLRLIYIGRISEIKGVHTLLQALCRIQTTSKVELDIYGDAIDAGYLTMCEGIARGTGPRVKVEFHGPVMHDEVSSLFLQADLFVLPTASENFGHVVGEALANGCPVAVPDTTPWTSAVEKGGGWVLPDREPSTVSATVERAAKLSVEQRYQRKKAAAMAYREHLRHTPEGGLDRMMSGLAPVSPSLSKHLHE